MPGSGICLILFSPHVARSLRTRQMWKPASSSCLPDQLQMGTIHSCSAEMPSERMCLLCFSNQYSGRQAHSLKSQPRNSDWAGFFTCGQIVISIEVTGMTVSFPSARCHGE